MMSYINLLNDCPIAYVNAAIWGWESGVSDAAGFTYELYSPYGEVLAFPTRAEAVSARRDLIAEIAV